MIQVPLLGIYLKNKKILIQIDIYIPMLTVALFITAKIWKQSKCPLTENWIKKMQYMCKWSRLNHKKVKSCHL